MRTMVIEKTNDIAKTFAEKDFFINSTETDTQSMHDFPGGVGSLAQHTSQTYAYSPQLAAHIQSQQYASDVPVLLKTEMTGIKRTIVNGETIFEVTTNAGFKIKTKTLLTGTGLGEVSSKVQSADYKSAFTDALAKFQIQKAQLMPIMAADTFLVALKRMAMDKRAPVVPKHIIVIGDGDGSRISLEGLSKLDLPKGLKITWVGNNFQTAAEYVASRDGDRYIHQIVPLYEKGMVTGISGYAKGWQKNADGSMRLIVKDKASDKLTNIDGDMIIDATGYNNGIPELLSAIDAQPTLQDVLGPLPELHLASTTLARQAVSIDGKALNMFVVGAAAGPLPTPEELKDSPNKNGIAIFNTIARTSMLVSRLTNTKPFEANRGVRETRPRTLTAPMLIQQVEHQHKVLDAAEHRDAS